MAEGHTARANSLDGIDMERIMTQCFLPFDVLMCGKTGVGKSSLINSLTGVEVCGVNDPALLGNFGAGTTTVTPTLINLSGVLLQVWDSPGLQDGTDHEEEYLDEMYEKCKDVALVLYCMDMTVVRWTPPEENATKLLTERFGVDFWKKAVLILTKANVVTVPRTYKGKEGIYHKQLYENFVRRFREQLIQQGVPEEGTANLRAVAAGYCDPDDETEKDRYIYYASDKAKVSKENAQCDFLQELWITCFEILSDVDRAKFMTMTENRIKPYIPTEEQKRIEELKALLKDEKDVREKIERKNKGAYEKIKREMDIMQQQLAEARKVQPYHGPQTVVPADRLYGPRPTGGAGGAMAGAAVGAAVGSAFGPIGTALGFVFGGLFGGR